MPSVGIIGAGPAGLTAGYLLSKEGFETTIWETDPQYVGGISRTAVYKGYRFDIGGHRFYSKSQEVEDLWTEILPDDLITCSRLSRIYYKGKFYSYPLDIAEVVENIGKRQSALTLASYFKAKVTTSRNAQNLEEWVTNKFGRRLYQMFFKNYTEKVWGMPCSEISADWAAQRIKGLSLSKAARNALLPKSSKRKTGNNRSSDIKTLITSFRYPRLGPGMLWEAAVEKITNSGGSIKMGTSVEHIERTAEGRWRVSAVCDGQIKTADIDHLISSAPLGWLISNISPRLPTEALEAAQELRYRDFLTVALILRPRISFADNWIYIHDPDLKVGRIQNFGNWSAAMIPEEGMACYGMEYFTSTEEPFWAMDDADLIAFATRELEALGLAQSGDVIDGAVVRQPKAYPVYDDDYQHRRNVIKQVLQRYCPNLHVVGRNGMHQYNNQDHSMMTGMLTAKNIAADKPIYDVWQVNQDAEYLETEIKKMPSTGSTSSAAAKH
jgi:protoporphyrinogen oxidase